VIDADSQKSNGKKQKGEEDRVISPRSVLGKQASASSPIEVDSDTHSADENDPNSHIDLECHETVVPPGSTTYSPVIEDSKKSKASSKSDDDSDAEEELKEDSKSRAIESSRALSSVANESSVSQSTWSIRSDESHADWLFRKYLSKASSKVSTLQDIAELVISNEDPDVELIRNLERLEVEYQPDADYLQTCQSTITWMMRALLVEWMVEVCKDLELSRETLHHSVNFIDRYLTKVKNVTRPELQLIGMTALVVAMKIEVFPCCCILHSTGVGRHYTFNPRLQQLCGRCLHHRADRRTRTADVSGRFVSNHPNSTLDPGLETEPTYSLHICQLFDAEVGSLRPDTQART
jgi:hypothetical protein